MYKMPAVEYSGLYYGFSPEVPAGQKFFNPLFTTITNIDKTIRVVGPFPEYPPIDIHNKNKFWVSFSGESFHQPLTEGLYDVHLIMQPTNFEKRIVWLPLFSVYAYIQDAWPKLMVPRNIINPKTKFCAMTVSDSRGDVRNAFFDKLNTICKIDSIGNWKNNTGYILPRGEENNPDGYLKDYKFIMCFENKVMSHYMTEKLLHAYLAGAIPVYAGASVSREILNPKAFLYLEDTSDEGMTKLISQMLYLAENPEAYMEMHQQPLFKTPEIPKEMTLEYFRKGVEKFAR